MKNLIKDINQLLNEEDIVQGYYAVVLSDDSKNKVSQYANYKIIQSHHITIAYNPTVSVSEQLNTMLGKRISIKTKALCENNDIQAFTVDMKNLKRADNGIAHITVSHTEKVKPVESNNMLKNPDRMRRIEIELNGTFKFLAHKKKGSVNTPLSII